MRHKLGREPNQGREMTVRFSPTLPRSTLQQAQVQQELKLLAEKHFANSTYGLYAVTLTFKAACKDDAIKRNADIRHFLYRLNAKVYGKAARRLTLKCLPIFELNASDGVHAHMILGMEQPSDRLSKPFADVVVDTWIALNCAGVRAAQDVQAIYDLSGWVHYVTKEIESFEKLGRIDWLNFR